MRTPYFIIGIGLMLAGIIGITGKFKSSRDWFWDLHFDSEKSQKILKIIGKVFSALVILLGLYLLAKGIFDPSKGLGFHF